MNRKAPWGIALVVVVSCSKPELPRTTGFADAHKALAKLNTICKLNNLVGQTKNNGNPIESRKFVRELCELSLDKAHTKVWGDAVVEFQGHSFEYGDFCGVHIGPAEVNNPVRPNILANFIDDPALARQIDAKLAAVDATKEYSYQERVAGFQLDVVQQGVNLAMRDAFIVDLRMNGCDQYPDSSPPVLNVGRTVAVH